jgi:hypothetical protein
MYKPGTHYYYYCYWYKSSETRKGGLWGSAHSTQSE